jgi:hypothetical protein
MAPPELQGKRLDQVTRTSNHDSFGMAVLVFNLLFMGRHPFAGKYLGRDDMPMDKAIAQFRFAYSARAKETHAQTVTEKLQGCLTIEDASKERLDCYVGVVPPDPKPKPPTAKVVADCKFLREEDERLGCFNRFLVKPARPAVVRKGAPKVEPSK